MAVPRRLRGPTVGIIIRTGSPCGSRGVEFGMAHGETDELGWDAVQGRVHVHDLHATIFHLLGLDHEKLTFRHAGRDFRLTDVSGVVVRPILL